MLLEQHYKIDDVITIKFSSGEELIGKLQEETDEFLKIRMTLKLVAGKQR